MLVVCVAQIMWGKQNNTLELQWPEDVYSPIKKLGSLCMSHDPKARPTADQVSKALLKIEQHLHRKARAAAAREAVVAATAVTAAAVASAADTVAVTADVAAGGTGAVAGAAPAAQQLALAPASAVPLSVASSELASSVQSALTSSTTTSSAHTTSDGKTTYMAIADVGAQSPSTGATAQQQLGQLLRRKVGNFEENLRVIRPGQTSSPVPSSEPHLLHTSASVQPATAPPSIPNGTPFSPFMMGLSRPSALSNILPTSTTTFQPTAGAVRDGDASGGKGSLGDVCTRVQHSSKAASNGIIAQSCGATSPLVEFVRDFARKHGLGLMGSISDHDGSMSSDAMGPVEPIPMMPDPLPPSCSSLARFQ